MNAESWRNPFIFMVYQSTRNQKFDIKGLVVLSGSSFRNIFGAIVIDYNHD
jgi:hypothetical protein